MLLILALFTVLSSFSQEPHRGLRDGQCGEDELLVGVLDGVSVYVRCESVASNRVMNVVVRNEATNGQPLRGYSIGFCGAPVVSVGAPIGWRGEVHGSPGRIAWAVLRDRADVAISPGQRLSGFSVTLRPGWTMSYSMDVDWLDLSGSSTLTTHDCP